MYYLIKWWQITYYNVGSFRLELHSLKLDLRLSLSLSLSDYSFSRYVSVSLFTAICITHFTCFSVWLLRKPRKTVEKEKAIKRKFGFFLFPAFFFSQQPNRNLDCIIIVSVIGFFWIFAVLLQLHLELYVYMCVF